MFETIINALCEVKTANICQKKLLKRSVLLGKGRKQENIPKWKNLKYLKLDKSLVLP